MDLLTSMRLFVAVAEAGHFSAAADRLGISRAVASKYVQHLETHLGARLLQRTTRKLRLTDSGSAYLERCRQILADIDEAEADVAQQTAKPSGMLRVTLPVSFGIRHVAPLIAPYLARYPDVRIDLTLNDRRVDLIEEGFDLAIRVGPALEPGLVARRLGTDRMVICASPEYLARKGTPTHPEHLAEHNCILYSHASGNNEWATNGPDGSHSIRVGGSVRVNNGDFINRIVVDGAGLMCQPGFLVEQEIRAGRLVRLLPDYAFQPIGIYAVYPSRQFLSAKIRTFVDFVAAHFAERQDWSDAP